MLIIGGPADTFTIPQFCKVYGASVRASPWEGPRSLSRAELYPGLLSNLLRLGTLSAVVRASTLKNNL